MWRASSGYVVRDYSLLAPVKLPEFGNAEAGWAMCINPMCEHFCAFFGPEDEPGSATPRYKLIGGRPVRLKCRGCRQSVSVRSHRALRPVARHFLSLSLPFADCALAGCPNHGVNVFKRFGQRTEAGRMRYRAHGLHTLVCTACAEAGRKPAAFSTGVSAGLTDTRAVRTDLRWMIGSVREHLPVTAVRGLFGTSVGSYYRRLFRLAARIGDYLAWRNAWLLNPEFRRPHGGTVRVYTDVLNVSLHQVGDVARSKLLRIIVSVVDLEKTHFVLAAHPYFLPEAKSPDEAELERGHDDTDYLKRRRDSLETVFGDAPLIDEHGIAPDLPSEGHAGYFLKSPYAEVAHFLAVEKMLAGFARRHYTMDAARDLFQSALVAMRRSVLNRKVEIALFQYKKLGDSRSGKEDGKPGTAAGRRPGGRKRADAATLRTAWKDGEGRFRYQRRVGRLALDDERTDASVRAAVWKEAFRGGFSKAGGWAWLRFPLNVQQSPDARALRLTRRPGDRVDDALGVLLHATLQPVDATFASVRRACAVLGGGRSTYHYASRRPSQAVLSKRIREIAETRVRYGYRRIHVLLRREGCTATG